MPITSLITSTNQVPQSSRVSYFEVASSTDNTSEQQKTPDILVDLEGEANDVNLPGKVTPTPSERSSVTGEGKDTSKPKKTEKKRAKDKDKKKNKKNKKVIKIEVAPADQDNDS